MKIKTICYFIIALPAIILGLIGGSAMVIMGLIIALLEGDGIDDWWECFKKGYRKGLELDFFD